MKYSLVDLRRDFPNDGACLEFLFKARHSYRCTCGGEYRKMFKMKDGKLVGRKQYYCSWCAHQISPMANTIFHKSTTPLTLWFHAIWVFSNAKSGISAKELERQLGVTYKTAWRMLHLIRKSVQVPNKPRLTGEVEVDEAFFGGKGNGGTYNENAKAVIAKKARAIAAQSRGGDLIVRQVKDLTAKTIEKFVVDNVNPEGTTLMTDSSNRYSRLALRHRYRRRRVNHSRKQWAFANIHINNIENFWSHVKRSIKGTYKNVSQQHLQEYLTAFAWHRNNRGNDLLRFEKLLYAIVH